jgi:hypothetical protein
MTGELGKANKLALKYLESHIPKSNTREIRQTVSVKISNKTAKNSHMNNLLNLAGFGNKTTSNTKTLTYNDELIAYLASDKQKTFKSFWNEHKSEWPILADFIRKFNIMTATAVPSESSFSIAGYTNRKQRSRLSAKNLKYSMLIRDKDKLETLIKKEKIENLI